MKVLEALKQPTRRAARHDWPRMDGDVLCAFAAIGVPNAMCGRLLQHFVRRVAFFLALVILFGCSDIAPSQEGMPAMGPDPAYRTAIAAFFKNTMNGASSYNAFEESAPRWVHSIKGWNWLICVRFQDHGHRRTFVFYFEGREIVDARYAVQTDACDAQIYSPVANMGPATIPLGPLY